MNSSKTIKPALRNLAAGDVLFREGEVGDFAYQIVTFEDEFNHLLKTLPFKLLKSSMKLIKKIYTWT